jgi:hypothetical protein
LLRQNYQIRTVEFFISSSDIDNIKQVQIFSKLVLNEAVDFSCNWIFNSAAVVLIGNLLLH